MSEIRDGGPAEGFIIRQAGEIEIDGPDGKETIRGLILEGSVADIRPAMVWYGERVRIAPLTASMPEDAELRRYIDRCTEMAHGGEFSWWGRLAEILASLSAKVEELTRDNIVAPAECGANCDDPHCHYSHHPLTLRQAYENSLERLRCVEASLAERDRIIAEKDKALDEFANPNNWGATGRFYTSQSNFDGIALARAALQKDTDNG